MTASVSGSSGAIITSGNIYSNYSISSSIHPNKNAINITIKKTDGAKFDVANISAVVLNIQTLTMTFS